MHSKIKKPIRFLQPLLICGLLWCATPGMASAADTVMGNPVVQSALEQNAARSAEAEAAPTSEFNQLLQDLSPLPVIALGLLGLIWIRRQTADL